MGKHLVIVESPAKAKTVNRYLGDDYVVAASVGHVRDLPARSPKGKKRKRALLAQIGTAGNALRLQLH